MNWPGPARETTAPSRSCQKILAFELYLQDFSWQANQAGFGHVGRPVIGWAADRRPAVFSLFRLGDLRLSAIGAKPLHFDAEGAFELEKVSALLPDEKGRGYAAATCTAGAADAMDEVFRHFG